MSLGSEYHEPSSDVPSHASVAPAGAVKTRATASSTITAEKIRRVFTGKIPVCNVSFIKNKHLIQKN